MNKKRIIILISLLSIVLIALIGFTYAYFTTKIIGNTNNKSVEISAASLDLEYKDGNNEIVADKIIPGTTIATKTFSVVNTGSGYVKDYVVYLENVINELSNQSDLVYTLTCESIKTTTKTPTGTCNGLNESTFPSIDRFIVQNDIDIGITHYYTLSIKYIETEEDQTIDMGKTISAKVNIYDYKELNRNGLKISSAQIYGNTTFSNTPSITSPATLISLGEATSSLNIISKPENLFTNGYAETLDNTNFTSFKYSSDSPNGDIKGSFYHNTSTQTTIKSDDYIKIDPSKKYTYSMYLKNMGNLDAKYYIGLAEYDIDKKIIGSPNILSMPNTLTYLTSDLKDGDTIVHLNDISNFQSDENTKTYRLGFIFWNYKDSTGHLYEPLTYSRNVFTDLFLPSNVDKNNNTIALKVPWKYGTIKSGTKLSQSNDGSTYNYAILGNSTINPEWKKYSNTLSGENSLSGMSSFDEVRKFRTGTKYIKFLIIDNIYNVPNSEIHIAGISLTKTPQTSTKINLESYDPLRCVGDVCDYIDMEKKQIVRQVGKLILPTDIYYYCNKNEDDNYVSIYPQLPALELSYQYQMNENTRNETIYSTHFPYVKSKSTSYKERKEVGIMGYKDRSAAFMITALASDFPDANAWKQFLIDQQNAGTPFTIYYQLKNPYTESIEIPDSFELAKSQNTLEACDTKTCGTIKNIAFSK